MTPPRNEIVPPMSNVAPDNRRQVNTLFNNPVTRGLGKTLLVLGGIGLTAATIGGAAAAGYHTGIFDNLGEHVGGALSWTGERASFAAQNFYNFARNGFTAEGLTIGAQDRGGQIYRPGSGILSTPNPSSDLIT